MHCRLGDMVKVVMWSCCALSYTRNTHVVHSLCLPPLGYHPPLSAPNPPHPIHPPPLCLLFILCCLPSPSRTVQSPPRPGACSVSPPSLIHAPFFLSNMSHHLPAAPAPSPVPLL